jgi:hypothetical protein
MIDLEGPLHHRRGGGEDFVAIPGQRRINPLAVNDLLGLLRRRRPAPGGATSAAQSERLGANDRRLRARRGAPTAITAMTHKLARLVYRMLTYGQPYVAKGLEHDEARFRQQRLQWLHRQARELNLQLVPHQPIPSPVS